MIGIWFASSGSRPAERVTIMKQLANSTKNLASSPLGRNELTSTEVVEVSLLLSRSQINQLANQAHRRGLTSAQFLRQCISNMCQTSAEAV